MHCTYPSLLSVYIFPLFAVHLESGAVITVMLVVQRFSVKKSRLHNGICALYKTTANRGGGWGNLFYILISIEISAMQHIFILIVFDY